MITIENKEQLANLAENNKAVILYFFSNKCAPCVALRPKIFNLVDKDFPLCKLAFIESEKHPELAAENNVFASPTIILFFENKEYQRYSKYVSLNELSTAIGRPYKLLFQK